MPSLFSRSRTTSTPSKKSPANALVANAQSAYDEFGRVNSRGSGAASPFQSPLKKDAGKDKKKVGQDAKSRTRTLSSPRQDHDLGDLVARYQMAASSSSIWTDLATNLARKSLWNTIMAIFLASAMLSLVSTTWRASSTFLPSSSALAASQLPLFFPPLLLISPHQQSSASYVPFSRPAPTLLLKKQNIAGVKKLASLAHMSWACASVGVLRGS
ncbi:hypothetical protein JVT61DRAFT_6394 [Boletus reticuloceps]|uniref:Uncharacterized protein n=1 Tax=Boletus reticuloceps TaxID=495285 RepID=A0A8I2YKB8_9AGAM|nr:hypothetical protein JVT61DRAFT_6394 [Boletus reticuloceps]